MFKDKDLLIGYILIIIPFIIIGTILNIHNLLLYIIYIPLFILCKLEDSGYKGNFNINEPDRFVGIPVNQITSKIKIEPNHFNFIRENRYAIKNYKADYKLHGYPNVVREYTYGNNLYEVQAKYKADPKVSKLIRVIEIN